MSSANPFAKVSNFAFDRSNAIRGDANMIKLSFFPQKCTFKVSWSVFSQLIIFNLVKHKHTHEKQHTELPISDHLVLVFKNIAKVTCMR